MGDSRIIQVTLKAIADMSDVTSNVKQIQNLLSQLKLSPNLKGDFTKIFGDIEKNVQRASQAMANGFKTKGDVKAYSTAMEAIEKALISMQTNMEKIKPGAFSELLKDNQELQAALQASSTQLQTFKQELASRITGTDAFKELNKDINTFKDGLKSASVDTFFKKLEEGDIPGAEKALKRLDAVVAKQKKDLQAAGETSGWEKSEQLVARLRQGLQAIASDGSVQSVRQQMTELEQSMKNMSAAELDKLKKEFQQLTGVDLSKLIEEFRRLYGEGLKSGQATQKLNSELDMFKSRISYFFGMTNAVMLFRRALRSTFETVKDLDKVMTETAVVTEFDVGDMWSQLPEYTERANQLGVSIHDAYEAATLYYQQGLSTNEVMAVSNETLKMARIAGLDAAEATDRMTNALRGFNMEITESNAQNINDVYSNLAAKTASNVDEISTAMTKVASLAHNANMSFENTAAFLSQIIETTRESAETAGTALKTVIARFSEVKKLYSTGDLLGTDEEGEEINVNKVSAALRTAGINLNEYLTGMKGLDEIFMELSEKWDSLDQVQQRYIATMAAGSRQQSRFIALMQDNARMTELVSYANNAAGASEGQFEKTLESLESKLNELKNTWNTFLMGIANSDAIKFAVDALTNLFKTLNKISENLPGLAKSFTNIALLVGGFKLGRSIIGKIFPSIAASFKRQGNIIGSDFGRQISLGFKTTFIPGLDSDMKRQMQAAVQDIPDVNLQNRILTTYETQGYEAAVAEAEGYKDKLAEVDQKTKEFKGGQEQTALSLTKVGGAITAFGGLIMLIGRAFDDGTKGGKKAAKTWNTVGTVILGVGMAVMTAGRFLDLFGVKVTAAGVKAFAAGMYAQLGWAGLISIFITLGVLITAIIKGIKAYNEYSPEKKLERAQKATQEAADAANRAKESYDNLKDSIDSIQEKTKSIEEMTTGTQEWRDAVQSVNSEILELIGNYKELVPYVTSENGMLSIDFDKQEVQDILNQQAKNVVLTSSASVGAQRYEGLAQNAVDYEKLTDVIDRHGYFQDKESLDLISKALAGDQKARQLVEEKTGVSSNLSDEEYFKAAITAFSDDVTAEYMKVNEVTIEQIREYGNSLMTLEKETESYDNILASNAVSLANLTEGQKQYAQNYLNSGKWQEIYESQLRKIDINDSNRKDYQDEYAKSQHFTDYDAFLEENSDFKWDDKVMEAQFASARATEEATKSVEKFAAALDNAPDSIKRLYEENEGRALNKSDIAKTPEDFRKEYLSAIGKDLSELSEEERELYLAARDKWLKDREFAEQRYGAADEKLGRSGITLGENAGKLNSDSYSNFADQLLKVISSSGPQAAQAIADDLEKVLGKVPEEYQDIFMERLNTMDWNNLEEVEDFANFLEEMGVEINESDPAWQQFINHIKEGADSIRKFDLKSIIGQADNLAKIQKGIRENKDTRSFSEDDYNAMMSVLGSEWADKFVKDEEGNYRFIGGKMDNLADALSQNTSALLDEGSKRIDTKIGVRDILNSGSLSYDVVNSKDDLTEGQKAIAIEEIVKQLSQQGLDASNLQIEGLSNETMRGNLLQTGKTDEILEQILTFLETDLDAEKKQTDTEVAQAKARNNTAEQNAAMVNSEQGQVYADELLADAGDMGVDAEALEHYIDALEKGSTVEKAFAAQQIVNLMNLQKEIKLYDLDADAVKEFGKQLEKANDNLDPAGAKKVAVANARFQKGLQKLADTYEDWTDILDESGKVSEITGSEQAKTFSELKNTVSDLLAVGEDLPDQFFENAQNMELLKQIAEGDVEAISQLRAAAAESIVLDITGAANYDELNEVGQEVIDLINSWDVPDMEVGATLNDVPFITSLNNLMRQMGLSATQMNKIWSGLGFTAKVKPLGEYTPVMTVPSTDGRAPTIYSGPMADQAAMQMSSRAIQLSIPQFEYVFEGKDPSTSYTPATPSNTGSCFVAGTLVTTFSGLKPIESIQKGDIVLSYNEQTQQNEYSAVLQTMIHDVTENIYTLHIENDILEVTGIHRFYITRNNKKSWISVQDFQENDLVQFADGTLHRIERIEVEVRTTRVYNFEVSNNHNYYVGENQVLAHNKAGCFAAGTLVTLQGFYKNIEQVSVGDVVLSYNEEKKRNEYSTVVQTMIHLVKEKIYTLYVGRDKLVVTGIHRFYITREEETSWIPAEELCVGDKVRFADGTLHDIVKISTEEKSLIVYNFEVSNTHNYYVGRSQILAHNKSNNSGGGKDNKWKNPFDELFNLQEKINASIRERESLERKYQKLIQGTKTTTGEIRKNYTDQIKALRTQVSLQKKMKAGRLKQIKDLGNQKFTYENSKGKTVTTTFKKMGVTKYASFDKNTGAITIDWKGLEKLTKKTTDANKGAAAEEYINQLQELADSVNEIGGTIEDIEQTIQDQNLEALGLYNDFEERMKDAVVAGREKEIEKLEALSDAINDSSQKVIQGIQDQIAAQRQARENEKTEKDLADKEARLAYLQRDTSGANQAEIMALQKEIDEARQNYEDTLIDQTIDQMSKDADLAAEQRASQIQLMQDQLAVYQETGAIWKDVYSLINGMFTTDGKINWDSKGAEILKNAEGYNALSKAGKYLWEQETREGVFGAVQGMEAGNMNKAGDSVVLDKTITEGLKKHIAAMFVVRKDHGGWSEKRMKEVFGSGAKKEIWDLVNTYKKKPPKNMKNWATDKYTYDKQKNIKYSKYATGGLVDFTGPAWLDGTKSKPEIVLNAADSKNLIILKDVLASLLSGKNSSNSKNGGGDNYFDIDITAELKNDYDVDQLAARIKKQIQQDGQYRNVNAISFLR